MREIHLKYTDLEVFETLYTPEHYRFISTHMDAFKNMWTKQSKSFWCKHLFMYRHHCYNTGTVKLLIKENMKPFDMPVECIATLADQIFIVLYNEFVNCRYGAARELINDLTTLIANRNLVFACRNSSIRNNPFCMTETRDVFRKLLGCCRSYPQGMKDFYLLCLSYPIYGIFGGSIYQILKRWLIAREIQKPVETYLRECWQCPPELHSSAFVPQPFHRHILDKNGDKVDSLLFHGCFGLFSSNRGPLTEENVDVGKAGDGNMSPSFKKIFETFVEYISSREWLPSDKLAEDELNSDFNDYLREKEEDFQDEEFRRSMILKMAELKFKEEFKKDLVSIANEDNFQEIKASKKVIEHLPTCSKNGMETHPSSVTTKTAKVCKNEGCQKTTGTSSFDKCTNTAILSSDSSLKNSQKSSTDTVNSGTTNNNLTKKISKKKKKSKKCTDSATAVGSVNKGDPQTSAKMSIPSDVKPSSSGNNKVGVTTHQKESGIANCIQNPVGSAKAKGNQSEFQTRSGSSSTSIPGAEASRASSVELDKIKKNIDTIKQNVKEQSSLSMDGFRLMVETGSLLMSNDSHLKTGNSKVGDQQILQNCSQCSKTEEKPKSFKKCSRCKLENVKWVRYYCSRECQAKNWVDCHQEEHEQGLLVKK